MEIRVVVLGTGKRCQKCWLKLIRQRPDLKITALIDPSEKSRQDTLQEYPDLSKTPYFDSLGGFLNSEAQADIAVVCTPPQSHFQQIMLLMENGMDVLSEKPVVLSMEDGVRLAETAERLGRRFWVAQNFRFSQSAQYLRRVVMEEKYGKPGMAVLLYLRDRDGNASWLNKYPLTMENPMLFEQTEHHYDLFRYCYRTEIASVSGRTMNPSWSMYRHDATVSNLFETRNGMLIDYFGTWSSAHGYFDFQWRTDFEHGIILQKAMFSDMYEAERGSNVLQPVTLAPEEEFVTDAGVLFDNFLKCHTGTVMEEMPDIRDNLKTIALMFATLRAQKEKRNVYMDDFFNEYGI